MNNFKCECCHTENDLLRIEVFESINKYALISNEQIANDKTIMDQYILCRKCEEGGFLSGLIKMVNSFK